MGLLDGDIAALFGSAFSGIYLAGTLHGGTAEPVYEGGRITGYTGGDRPIKVQTDRVSASEKRSDDYSPGDVTLIILAIDTAGESDWKPNTDQQVTDGYGDRYRLGNVEGDAARSHWICRATPV